jgi:hypothetical protein
MVIHDRHGFIVSLILSVSMLALAWQYFLPPWWTSALRIVNGFIVIALLYWVVRRVLENKVLIKAHRLEILQLVRRAEEDRKNTVDRMMVETAELGRIVAEHTKAIQEQLHVIAETKTDKS